MPFLQRMYLSKNQKILLFVGISSIMMYHVIIQLGLSERYPTVNFRTTTEEESAFGVMTSSYERSSGPNLLTQKELHYFNLMTDQANSPSTIDRVLSRINFNLLEVHLNSASNIRGIIRETLENALKEDKGTGCDIAKFDPFSTDVAQFDKETTVIDCKLLDWVKCNFSKCSFVPNLFEVLEDGDLSCILKDILYKHDDMYELGPPTVLRDGQVYTLNKSDHVTINCSWRNADNFTQNWEGIGIGYRPLTPVKPVTGREKTPNVLIFGFDSVSKNTFIRKLPESYKFITEELGAVVLNKYNVVGDGTTPALFPLLTGISEIEHPECRRNFKYSGFVDESRFIFYKLKNDGYRTAYYEDMPWIGTFQHRLNGFVDQPTDHYLRAAFQEELQIRNKSEHCFGSTPRYQIMMDLTDQFFKLDGKRFAFTFVGHLTHEDFNTLSNADESLVEFLNGLKRGGRLNDTLLIVMSDHGCRFSPIRKIYQGKLEERLPFMAIRLPDELTTRRPEVAMKLKHNEDALTTPFDIYTTILDVIDMREHWNGYKVKGSDLARGMTLLEENKDRRKHCLEKAFMKSGIATKDDLQSIPQNRSCSEAGILPHWCSCLKWEAVQPNAPVYNRSAQVLVDYINKLTQFQRRKCAFRTLTSIDMVVKKISNKLMLQYENPQMELEIHLGRFGKSIKVDKQLYQVKVTLGPGSGTFEATLTYDLKRDEFYINSKEISRTNAYKTEPACVSKSYPHLNKYCYCK